MGNRDGEGGDARLERMEAQLAAITGLLAERVGPKVAARTLTLRGLYDAFAAAHGPPKPGAPPRHKSWPVMKNRLKPVIDYFGDKPAESLTPDLWPAYNDKRLADPVPYRGPNDPPADPLLEVKRTTKQLTVNHELGWTKRLFNWGMEPEVRLVATNPFAVAKRKKCRKKRETWITEDDVQSMLSSYNPRSEHARVIMRAFLLLMADQAFRFNEARRSRRDRIRIHEGHVVVDVGRTKNGKVHYRAMTKRTVEAMGEIVPVLGSPSFFVNGSRLDKQGKPVLALYSERHMRRWFRDMCEAAGVDVRAADGDVRLRPHDIRRSSATLALLRGVDLKAIQAMLNHSSLATTEIYLEGMDLEGAIDTAERMEEGAANERQQMAERRHGPRRSPLDVYARRTRTPKSSSP